MSIHKSEIPKALPAILRAQKVSKRASWAGFDWPDIRGVIKKVDEELKEVKKTLRYENKSRFKEELGDLLFTVVNLARFRGIDAEDMLNCATKKTFFRI